MELTSSLAASLTNHAPNTNQVAAIEELRVAADAMCGVVDRNVPSCREASLAKTHLEETLMWAVKAVILKGTAQPD